MSSIDTLFTRAERESESLLAEEALFDEMVRQSLRGDPSLVPIVAKFIGGSLVHQEHVPANYRVWLALMLAKLHDSPEACRIVAGSTGGGAPRKTFDAIKVALEVMRCIVEENSTSVVAALEKVSDQNHLSIDTVKLHWQTQQGAVWLVYGPEIREHMGFHDLQTAVKAMTASARELARGK